MKECKEKQKEKRANSSACAIVDSAQDYRGSGDQSSSDQKGQTRDSTQIKDESQRKLG